MTTSPRSDSRPVVIGDRYELLRPLASGGMAEIFLARQKALAGFEKEVVVKRLHERWRSDKRVVEMFLDEARIGAILNHPNIVHVYDVGEHEGTPYIAMELIHGDELSTLCRRGLELGQFLPVAHAVDLMRQAAEGMGYFHAKRAADGKHLDIVHRDISPSNLLVTRDGGLKVIDFGIARSRVSRAAADAEKSVPGKWNYMAPEQVRGERTDHRADIFSLGIVLYEITVGKRLFKGRPEEVMQKITRGKIKPPTFVRRDFPAPLEAVVMRALEAHADDRYQSAYELAADLEDFLRVAQLHSGPVKIARYLDDLDAAAGKDRRPELVVAGEAWVDDEGEDALDFSRNFADVKKDAATSAAGAGAGAKKPAASAAWDDASGGDVDDAVTLEEPAKEIAKAAAAAAATKTSAAKKVGSLPLPAPPATPRAGADAARTPSPTASPSPSPSPSRSPESNHSRRAQTSFGDGIVARQASPMRWVLLAGVIAAIVAAVILATA